MDVQYLLSSPHLLTLFVWQYAGAKHYHWVREAPSLRVMFDFLCFRFRSSRALDLLSCAVRISPSLSTRWWLDMGPFLYFLSFSFHLFLKLVCL